MQTYRLSTRSRLSFKILLLLIGISITVVCLLELLTVSCDKYQPASEHEVSMKTQALRKHNDTFFSSKTCLKDGKNSSLEHLIRTNSIDHFDNGIPKLLHSTWKTHVLLNEDWDEVAKECRRVNSNFTFCHWDDADLEAFVASHYPNFLHHFLTYPYPIQRADVSRYLLLQTFGGFYKDTNIGCLVPFHSIVHEMTALTTPYSLPVSSHSKDSHKIRVLLFKVDPSGIAADFIASTPHHPFFLYISNNLKTRPSRFGLPYIDVMFGTGPLFLGQMYRRYLSDRNIPEESKEDITVIPTHLHQSPYFYFLSGGTWHCLDGKMIWWSYNHLYLLSLFVVLILLTIYYTCKYFKCFC